MVKNLHRFASTQKDHMLSQKIMTSSKLYRTVQWMPVVYWLLHRKAESVGYIALLLGRDVLSGQ